MPTHFISKKAQQLLPGIAILGLWEICARMQWINPFIMPAPTVIANSLLEMTLSGALWADVRESLIRVFAGFGLAVLIGTPVGIAMALSPRVQLMLGPLVQLLRPIPPIAWIPLSILWFGLGGGSSYFLTMVGAFFPIVLNSHLGVSSVPSHYLQVARCFEASKSKTFFKLIWPASLPYILAGHRIGFGVAWMSLVGAEMLAVQSGLGYLIHVSQDLLKTERVIAGMFVIGVIGLSFDFAMRKLERRLNPWFEAGAAQ